MSIPKIRKQIESRVQDVGDTMAGFLTLSGNPTSNLHAATKQYVDNKVPSVAETANKLSSAKTISLIGDVSGSGSFDGSNNLSITATVADNSHNHSNYLLTSGGTMTGPLTMGSASGGIIADFKGGADNPFITLTGYPEYGIRYHEGTPDKMTFSASGNASTPSSADLCINGNGDGAVTIRGNTILHAGNYTSYASPSSHNHNTLYAFGDGSGRGTMIALPRTTADDLNIDVKSTNEAEWGLSNKAIYREYGIGCSNMPNSNYWWHILTAVGSDRNYATQLALGMTVADMSYRCRTSGNWHGWYQIFNAANSNGCKISSSAPGVSTYLWAW